MTDSIAATKFCHCTGRAGYTRPVGSDDFVCASCGRVRQDYEEATTKLVYFRGGELDGRVYTIQTLLSIESIHLPIIGYWWTPEKIRSERTGSVARVWVWDEDRIAGDTGGAQRKDERTDQMAQNTTADGVTNTQLLARRQALKLSRPVIAEKAGVTVSQLANMEISGKRVKEGVMDKVHAALTHFETEAGAGSAPAPTAASGDASKEDHTSAKS